MSRYTGDQAGDRPKINGNKGVASQTRRDKREAAEERNARTLPERRRAARRA